MRAPALILPLLLAAGAAAGALTLPPGAVETARADDPAATWTLPAGPVARGSLPETRVEGTRTRQAFRVPGAAETAALMADLRAAARQAGWQPAWSCADLACGGFDFRFALELLDPPAMHVNLGDFRYAAFRRDGPDGAERLALLVSAGGGAGYVHLTIVRPAGAARDIAPAVPATAPEPEPGEAGIAAQLDRAGRAVLPGVAFATGSARLEPGADPALAALADWLATRPGARIALVGHTDFDGALAPNMALSRRRAEAVRDALVARHGVDPARLEAEGIGYLMPLGANTTEAGRARNRRVEAVVVALP